MNKLIVLLILLIVFVYGCVGEESPQIAMFEKFKGGTPSQLQEDAVLPFELQRSHVIKVSAIIKDKPYTMIFDTGGMTMLEKSINDSLGFETVEIPQQKVQMAIVDELRLGAASVSGMKVGLIGFDDTFKFDLPGMIGSDYLRFFNVEIDYEKQNITLRNSHKLKNTTDKDHMMDIKMMSPYFPTVNIEINGQHHFPAIIDTGLHYAFVFPIVWLENLSETEKEELIACDGYFARWPWTESPQNYLYLMPELKLGDIVLQDVPVIIGEVPVFLSNSAALVGKYFFENYITTIDYPNRQMKLTETSKTNYSLRFSAGINIAKKDEKLKITGVWQNSPAFEAGLKTTDELLAVNSKTYDEISEMEIADTIMDKTNIKFYVTVVRDGKEEEILLKKRDLFE